MNGHMSSEKNAELEAKHQKYKGRVVLRGDIVKEDSGSYAVFTEQGSSASQMTAAKIMDIISRLPGCDGQAADAVSAYTQVKMEDDPKLLEIPKSECPDIWIRPPRHKWPKSWSSMEDPVVPLERNLYGHPLAGLLWERQFEKILLKHGWEKNPNWECLFVDPSRVSCLCRALCARCPIPFGNDAESCSRPNVGSQEGEQAEVTVRPQLLPFSGRSVSGITHTGVLLHSLFCLFQLLRSSFRVTDIWLKCIYEK